jgi:glucose/arabinose dehydrogenase
LIGHDDDDVRFRERSGDSDSKESERAKEEGLHEQKHQPDWRPIFERNMRVVVEMGVAKSTAIPRILRYLLICAPHVRRKSCPAMHRTTLIERSRNRIQNMVKPRWLFGVLVALVMHLAGSMAHAAFHVMQIEQVIGGVGGDKTAQAIQLRMRSAGQNVVQSAKLIASDATGSNPVVLIQFPSNVGSGAGRRILISTASFQQRTNPTLTPDFTFTNPIPPTYLAAGRITYTDAGGNTIYWSLAFGGASYTGSNTGSTQNDPNGNFGPPFVGPLPSDADKALLFQGTAIVDSNSNSTDYALTSGAATFTNNANVSATVVASLLPRIVKGTARIGLQSVATGLVAPNGLVPANDGTGRLFVVDQSGQIRIIKNGQVLPTPLLDVALRMVPINEGYDERGLLGFALHPDFATPGKPGHQVFYTYTSEPVSGTADFTITHSDPLDHHSVVAEWKISAGDPDVADVASRREVMRIDEPQFNHNGGQLAFRPSDHYLYISLGDGGAADDTGDGHSANGNGQDTSNVLGKILRIDPLDPSLTSSSSDAMSANGKYRVPANNPFVGTAGVDEIFAYGLRNPFRFSFDAVGDRLVVGDVGQNQVEEVDLVESGKNYGWRKKEGSFLFNGGSVMPDPNPDPNLINPVLQYSHDDGTAIIGGFVYHGTALPELAGKYIFGEFSNGFSSPAGRLFLGDLTAKTIQEFNLGLGDDSLGRFVKGFGEDEHGEIYVLASLNVGPGGSTGQVLKIVPLSTTARVTGDPIPGMSGKVSSTFGAPQTGPYAGTFAEGKKKTPAVFAPAGSVLFAVGDELPVIADSVISKLGAPSGDALVATLKTGPGGITAKTNTVLLADLSVGARVAAQTGTAQTGLPTGVTIKRFGTIDGNGTIIFFLATLQGTGVTAKNATALCAALIDGSVKILARVGDPVGAKNIATISTLVGSKGTLAEGRWRIGDTAIGVRLTFNDKPKSQTIYRILAGSNGPGDWNEILSTGPASGLGVINGDTITSFGLPGFGPNSFGVLANLAVGTNNVTRTSNVAVVTSQLFGPLSVIHVKGDAIPAKSDLTPLTGVTVKAFSDPVIGIDRRIAYVLTGTGKGFGTGIAYAEDGIAPKPIANVGASAPGGGHWASFLSLALPEGPTAGPIFTGKLAIKAADSVSAKNNLGLWAVDSSGQVQLLLRTNQHVFAGGANKSIKSFVALTPSTGSIGASSGYDDKGNVAVLATLSDGTKALLRLPIP